MNRYISIKRSDFYCLRGRIARVDFVIGILLTSLLVAAIYYLCRTNLLELKNSQIYFAFKAFLQLLGLSLATPFYVKRFHDLNSTGYWVIFYWVGFLFSFEVLYSIELLTGFQSSFFDDFALFIGMVGLLMLLVLLLKKGNPEENQWGNPNDRMQSDCQTAARFVDH